MVKRKVTCKEQLESFVSKIDFLAVLLQTMVDISLCEATWCLVAFVRQRRKTDEYVGSSPEFHDTIL